jgi:hypothetical protein
MKASTGALHRVMPTILLVVGLALALAAIAYLSRNTAAETAASDRKFFEHFNTVLRGPGAQATWLAGSLPGSPLPSPANVHPSPPPSPSPSPTPSLSGASLAPAAWAPPLQNGAPLSESETRETYAMQATESTALTKDGLNIVCENNPNLCVNGVFRLYNPVTGGYTSLPQEDGTNVLSGDTTVRGRTLDVGPDNDVNKNIRLFGNGQDGGTLNTYQGGIESWWGVGFRNRIDGKTRFVHDTRTGATTVDGEMTAKVLTIRHPLEGQADNYTLVTPAGGPGWYNDITRAGDTLITNRTLDGGRRDDPNVNGITLAPWNTVGGMRVHGKGATINGTVQILPGPMPNELRAGVIPQNWWGGLHTMDVYANGTVGAGVNGGLGSYINSSGTVYAGNNVCVGNTCLKEQELQQVKAGKNKDQVCVGNTCLNEQELQKVKGGLVQDQVCVGPTNNRWCMKAHTNGQHMILQRNDAPDGANQGKFTFSQDGNLWLSRQLDGRAPNWVAEDLVKKGPINGPIAVGDRWIIEPEGGHLVFRDLKCPDGGDNRVAFRPCPGNDRYI